MFTIVLFLYNHSSGISSRADRGKLGSVFLGEKASEWTKSVTKLKQIVSYPLPQLLRSTGRIRGTLPLTVLKVLASLACHGKAELLYLFYCNADLRN